MNKTIILIGGTPTAGKSNMAHLVAEYLRLPWISTDQIRDTMRLVAPREDHPNLFNPEGYTAERFLTEFSAEQIADIEMKQGEAVWPGIQQFIEHDYTWQRGFVMEGVNLLPHLIAKDFSNDAGIKPIFLVENNVDRIRDVVYTRGLWSDARTYSDEVKEQEVEWVLLFNKKLMLEIERYGYDWIDVKKQQDDFQKILSILAI